MDDRDRRILAEAARLVEIAAEQGWPPGDAIRIYTAAIGMTLSWSQLKDTAGVIDGIQDALNHITGRKEGNDGRHH